MGVDYSGGMLVGEHGSKLSEPEDYEYGFYEWAEENELEQYSEYYDADRANSFYGYPIPDVLVEDISDEWVNMIKRKAEEFEKLTGVKAKLIGTQSIS